MLYPALVDVDDARTRAELPTHWNCSNCSQFLEVSKDKRSVRYIGKGNHAHDVGSVQANKPVPSRMLLYYFEITVVDAGTRGAVAIGLSNRSFLLNRQPGWEPHSYGYHGDDGRKFHGSGRGDPYGPVFTAGDTVGCGLNFASQEIFFTKGGKLLGVAFKNVAGELFPTVGLHSPGEAIWVNFGQLPFKFDLDALASDIRERRQRAVDEVRLPVSVPNALVRDYLRHYGYADTLAAFDAATSSEGAPPPRDTRLPERRRIRCLIMEGDVEGAMQELEASFPGLLRGRREVQVALECQRVIEAVRRGDTQRALELATGPLAALREEPEEEAAPGPEAGGGGPAEGPAAGPPSARAWAGVEEDGSGDGTTSGSSDDEGDPAADGPEFGGGRRRASSHDGGGEDGREEEAGGEEEAGEEAAAEWGPEAAVGLLAYEDPEAGPLRHLLGPARREAVADAVNAAALASLGLPEASRLERALRQVAAVHGELREANGGRGELFTLAS